ncbi:MAG: hypothetical protein HWE14_07965 [Flavobacteriia bacterium]|nr:hypothetical protein [Flavobacteriia bacterium]
MKYLTATLTSKIFKPRMVSFVLLFGLIIGLSSCEAFKMVRQMNDTEVHTFTYTNGEQTLVFVPMIHVAKPEFYANVKNAIKQYKEQGYVYYYEWIDFDSASQETQWKIREMVGFLPSPTGYSKQLQPLVEQGYTVQKNDEFLNIVNDQDYNVDITAAEVVRLYEAKYGVISITELNKNTPMDEKYTATLDDDQVEDIILNSRNQHIVKTMADLNHEKILMTYGSKHREGIIEMLQKTDESWHEVE